MIHTLKGFGIVNKAEVDVFLELSCFLNDPADHLSNSFFSLFLVLLLRLKQHNQNSGNTVKRLKMY